MCGVIKTDKIRIEHVRGSVKVAPVANKITEKRLTCYGHDKRREEHHAKKNGRCTSRNFRKTENQMKSLV